MGLLDSSSPQQYLDLLDIEVPILALDYEKIKNHFITLNKLLIDIIKEEKIDKIVKMNEDFLENFFKDKKILDSNTKFYEYIKENYNLIESTNNVNMDSFSSENLSDIDVTKELTVTDAFVSSSGIKKSTKKSEKLDLEAVNKKVVDSLVKKTDFIEDSEYISLSNKEILNEDEAKNILIKISRNSSNRINWAISVGKILFNIKKMCKNTDKKLHEIISDVGTTKFNTSYRYFLIDMYKQSNEYPKFKYINKPLNFIMKYFKDIKILMRADPDFWKSDE